jgi:predicted RNA-binding protein with PUA domain
LSDSKNRVDAIAEALRRYSAEHGHAADTLEGVRSWLPAEVRAASRQELEAALQALVSEGVLKRRNLVDGTVVYFSAPLNGDSG